MSEMKTKDNLFLYAWKSYIYEWKSYIYEWKYMSERLHNASLINVSYERKHRQWKSYKRFIWKKTQDNLVLTNACSHALYMPRIPICMFEWVTFHMNESRFIYTTTQDDLVLTNANSNASYALQISIYVYDAYIYVYIYIYVFNTSIYMSIHICIYIYICI